MLDFETRSTVNLKRASYDKYAGDASTDVLCLGYQLDGYSAAVLAPPRGAFVLPPQAACPDEILYAIQQGLPIYAHNVSFDKRVYWHQCVRKMGWPEIPDRLWRCTMALAAYYAYPRALGRLAAARGQASQKDTAEGSRALAAICKPRSPRKLEQQQFLAAYGQDASRWPVLWQENSDKLQTVVEYCRRDVEAQTEFLLSVGPLPATIEKEWQFDRMLNERGVAVDMKSVAAASALVEDSLESYNTRIQQLTSTVPFPEGMATKVSQRDRLLRWFAIRGLDLFSLTAEAVAEALSRPGLADDVREVLQIRADAYKSSLAKLEALSDFCDSDGILRDTLVFHGATTGRWTGRGFQPHNLPRIALSEQDAELFHSCLHSGESIHHAPYTKCPPEVSRVLPEIVSRALRSFIQARPGKRLLCSDFNAIEARAAAWLAGCHTLLQQFERNECVYSAFASRATGKPVEQIGKKSEERQLGKVAVLGLQYGMGYTEREGSASKFAGMAQLQYGLTLDADTCLRIGKLYKATYPEIPALWNSLEEACKLALRTGQPQRVSKLLCYTTSSQGLFGSLPDFLAIQLPSGRSLWYPQPRLIAEKKKVGKTNRTVESITFETENPVSRRWVRQATWGGTLVENVVQAASRDVLMDAMVRVERAGMPVLLSVHDEVIAEGDASQFDLFHSLMEQVPAWATGLPLACESEHRGRYGK